MSAKIIFITGTDTGAGKTVLTALALCHLQFQGKRAAALKPFCSGTWEDTDLLRSLHQPPLLRSEVTRWFFKAPIAPRVAARREGLSISLHDALAEITRSAVGLDYLLVEGAGGLLTPLGDNFNLLNLIQELADEVLIAARNKLGVINHALLTIDQLQISGIRHWKLALMGDGLDQSSETNFEALAECLNGDSTRLYQISELDGFGIASAANYAKLSNWSMETLLMRKSRGSFLDKQKGL